MKIPRPASVILRLGASTALAVVWFACKGTTASSGHGGGTGGAECLGCVASCASSSDCTAGAICVTYCSGCTECMVGVPCSPDGGCPSGSTCDDSYGDYCVADASCSPTTPCPAGSMCPSTFGPCYIE